MKTGTIDFKGETCIFKIDEESFELTIEELEKRERSSTMN